MRKFVNKLKCKKGQGLIEYVLLMALLVVAAIFVLSRLGGTTKNKFDYVSDQLEATNE